MIRIVEKKQSLTEGNNITWKEFVDYYSGKVLPKVSYSAPHRIQVQLIKVSFDGKNYEFIDLFSSTGAGMVTLWQKDVDRIYEGNGEFIIYMKSKATCVIKIR